MDHEELFFVPGSIYEGTETVLEATVEEAEVMGRGWALSCSEPSAAAGHPSAAAGTRAPGTAYHAANLKAAEPKPEPSVHEFVFDFVGVEFPARGELE
jgi:hypothetical protein